MKDANADEWWADLTGGEKDFLRALMRMIQGAKHSQVVEVARAAQKWESGLSCFIKARLMHSCRAPKRRRGNWVISCQSNGRN
jgi:hypothetical protein